MAHIPNATYQSLLCNWPFAFRVEDSERFKCGQGGHLDHVTITFCMDFSKFIIRILFMKF